MRKTLSVPYSTIILAVLAVLVNFGYLYYTRVDSLTEAFKMRLEQSRDSIDMYQGKIDSVLEKNTALEVRVDSLDQVILENSNKVQQEIKIIQYREKEFKTLDDRARDSLVRSYIATNQSTDWE